MTNDTKHVLLDIARSLIDANGIESLSTREVGKEAGLSHTAFYRHFENKEALLAAIVVEDFKMLGDKINILELTISDYRELLFQVSRTYYDFAMANADHYQLMFNTKWDEALYPEIKESAGYVFERISMFVSEAVSRKVTDSKIITERTAILYAFMHGLVGLHLVDHNQESKGLHDVETLIRHMLDAVLSK